MSFLAKKFLHSLNRVRMSSGSIVTYNEYDTYGLAWVLEVFFVPVCEVPVSRTVEGT